MTSVAANLPQAHEIDPDFIFLSPTALRRSEFEVAPVEPEPVEPRILHHFDYGFYARWADESATRHLHGIRGRLRAAPGTYDRLFAVMSSKRYRAGTMTQTRFADNRDLWRSYSAGWAAGGSQAPVVNSCSRTSRLSRPHLVAVDR